MPWQKGQSEKRITGNHHSRNNNIYKRKEQRRLNHTNIGSFETTACVLTGNVLRITEQFFLKKQKNHITYNSYNTTGNGTENNVTRIMYA